MCFKNDINSGALTRRPSVLDSCYDVCEQTEPLRGRFHGYIPNHASAIVTTIEIVDAISSLQTARPFSDETKPSRDKEEWSDRMISG